jgi:hypothetical protein
MISMTVDDVSHVAEPQRAAGAMEEQNSGGGDAADWVASVATKLGTNLVKHGEKAKSCSVPTKTVKVTVASRSWLP